MLKVLSSIRDKKGAFVLKCECECGNITKAKAHELTQSKRFSCGCVRRNKHGESNTRLYNIWHSMHSRCDYGNKDYGGRGIEVCLGWWSYEGFRDWALNSGYKEDLTIERMNVNGDYKPDNCTWIPMSKQAWNTRRNILTIDKVRIIRTKASHGVALKSLAEEYGIDRSYLGRIINNKIWVE